MQLLLDRGAEVNHSDLMGNRHSAISVACEHNRSRRLLAERGARLGLVGPPVSASIDVVRTFFDERGRLRRGATSGELRAALNACAYGGRRS
jgi:hypothetical protein